MWLGTTILNPRVHLFGIEAPRHDQRLSSDATATLRSLFQHQRDEWRLLVVDNRRFYGRTLGLVYHALSSPNDSINRQMVRLGMAYWDPNYAPQGEYRLGAAELSARIERRGVWEHSARDGQARPWTHRAGSSPQEPQSSSYISDQYALSDPHDARIADLEEELYQVRNVAAQLRMERDLKHTRLRELLAEFQAYRTEAEHQRNELTGKLAAGRRTLQRQSTTVADLQQQHQLLQTRLQETHYRVRREHERANALARKNAQLQHQIDRGLYRRLQRLLRRTV